MPTLQQFPSEIPEEETALSNIARGTRPLVKALMDFKTSRQLQKYSDDPLASEIFQSTGGDIGKTTQILAQRAKSFQVPEPRFSAKDLFDYVQNLERERLQRDLTESEIQNIKEKTEDPAKQKEFQDFISKQHKAQQALQRPQRGRTFEEALALVQERTKGAKDIATTKGDIQANKKIIIEHNKSYDTKFKKAEEKSREAYNVIHTSELLSNLINSPSSNLPNPLIYNILSKISPRLASGTYGNYTDAQKFKSYIKEYYTGLQSIFGSRPSIDAIQRFSDALPKLENTKEANTAILQNKVAHAKVDRMIYDKLISIKEKYNRETGNIGYPLDIEAQLNTFFDDTIDPFLTSQQVLHQKIQYLEKIGKNKNIVYNSVNFANATDTAISSNKDSIIPEALVSNIHDTLEEMGKRYPTKEKLDKDLALTKANNKSFGVKVGEVGNYNYILRYNRDLKVFETIREKKDG